MSDDLHDRIKAAVDEWRDLVRLSVLMPPPWRAFVLAICDHADDVLARHYPARGGHDCWCGHGGTDEQYDPQCPEVRALATAWLGDGWNQ